MKLENWERTLPDHGSYWLTRFIILRLLGFIYAIAFLVAANQILPLIGSDGLLPVGNFLDHVQSRARRIVRRFSPAPIALLV